MEVGVKLGIILVSILLVIGIAGCGEDKEVKTEMVETRESPQTIDEMISVLNDGGYNAVKEENIKVSSFAADSGAKTTVGETEIEFYVFNDKPKIKAGAKKAFENPNTKVIQNGDIIVVIYSSETVLTSRLEELLA